MHHGWTIYIVDNLNGAVPFGRISDSTAGFYVAGDTGIAAFATKGEFGQKVLLHEFAHHYMFAATGQAYARLAALLRDAALKGDKAGFQTLITQGPPKEETAAAKE
jgi:hypothetical protein